MNKYEAQFLKSTGRLPESSKARLEPEASEEDETPPWFRGVDYESMFRPPEKSEPEPAPKVREVPSPGIVADNQTENWTSSAGTSRTGTYDNTACTSVEEDIPIDTESRSILSSLPETEVPSLEPPETAPPPQPPAALPTSRKKKTDHRIDPSGALELIDGLSYSDTARAIMKSSGCSRSTAEKFLKDALASGLVEVDRTGAGKPSFYSLTDLGLEWAYKSGDATSRGYWRKKLRAKKS